MGSGKTQVCYSMSCKQQLTYLQDAFESAATHCSKKDNDRTASHLIDLRGRGEKARRECEQKMLET